MHNVADVIERFILAELFDDKKEFVNVQRRELAQQLECAPSQITYTLTTRFTPERGYEVISKRGTGGFIRIVRLPDQPKEPHLALSAASNADQMIKTLAAHKAISAREAKLLNYNLEILGNHISEEDKCTYVRKAYECMSEEK